jgi:bleomycin hydrolase
MGSDGHGGTALIPASGRTRQSAIIHRKHAAGDTMVIPRRTFALFVFIALTVGTERPAQAQGNEGISSTLLNELRAGCPDDRAFRVSRNALAQTDGSKISLNESRINHIDGFFSNRLKDQSVTNQKSSGRCWMFSGLNTLRPVAQRTLGINEVEFSESYLFFYDKLEKANVYLEAMIRLRDHPLTDRILEFLLRAPVQDGGNWLGFIELIKKYGVVPRDVMPETYSSSNSYHVNRVLGIRLRQYGLRIRAARTSEEMARLRREALKDVYRILALNFGIPPERFSWRYENVDKSLTPLREYTPQEFYRASVGINLDDYVALYSIPTLPFLKKYEIELDKAVEDKPTMFFVNVPLEEAKALALTTILHNEPVWFGCDVGQEANTDSGILATDVYDLNSLYGMDFSMSRTELFETYQSIPNHNMVFTGVDTLAGRPQKWLVENSWGDRSGKKGYLIMTDDWFDKYVQVVVINKKYLPAPVLAALDQKATTLPPWDPMFRGE